MNLDSRDGGGLFSLTGVLKVESGANVEIKNINNFVINGLQGAYISVQKGGTLKINNVDSLINISSDTGAMGIQNLNSTICIDADVYNYDKNSLEGGGNFTQISNNAETTIDGSFYNIGLNSGVQGREEAIVQVYNGKFNVTGDFYNGKNNPDNISDYLGAGVLSATNGALITVNGNFISDAQGEKFLNNANLAVKGKFDVSRTDIYLKEIIIMHLITTKTITILTTITTIAIILLIQ
ncbi:hypothetical protein [Campylobacter avium]|uniref:hypothetical protein n=1 Tax=Campylobacter avium TaxID=522485 RepID=UPI002354DC54|nr:hypothetical protein [Campylobacter avium]